jgi:hypothetical protein
MQTLIYYTYVCLRYLAPVVGAIAGAVYFSGTYSFPVTKATTSMTKKGGSDANAVVFTLGAFGIDILVSTVRFLFGLLVGCIGGLVGGFLGRRLLAIYFPLLCY